MCVSGSTCAEMGSGACLAELKGRVRHMAQMLLLLMLMMKIRMRMIEHPSSPRTALAMLSCSMCG